MTMAECLALVSRLVFPARSLVSWLQQRQPTPSPSKVEGMRWRKARHKAVLWCVQGTHSQTGGNGSGSMYLLGGESPAICEKRIELLPFTHTSGRRVTLNSVERGLHLCWSQVLVQAYVLTTCCHTEASNQCPLCDTSLGFLLPMQRRESEVSMQLSALIDKQLLTA